MKIKQYINYGLLVFAIFCLSACSKKDANPENEIGGKASPVKAFPGRNRIILSWLTDSKADKARIQWNNRSIEVTIKEHLSGDTVKVLLDSMAEGTYIFDIYTYDNQGNSLPKISGLGKVYGDQYISTLINRPLKNVNTEGETLSVEWGEFQEKALGTQIRYSDVSGALHTAFVPADSSNIILKDVRLQDSILARTLYLPDTAAIDTFYTSYDPVELTPVYDETNRHYNSYTNLLMAGYQGWFAADGDGSDRGWYHYKSGGSSTFAPGSGAAFDFWPDMTEYTKTYVSPFKFADGKSAYLYSPYDAESVDLHFKWMKDYHIDGVFMQRFVTEIKDTNPAGKKHFNKVLENALAAAKKYDRAICIMYDLSGCKSTDMVLLEKDWAELQTLFHLFDSNINPTYLHHNKKPLLAIWGVGFVKEDRDYTTSDAVKLVSDLKGYNNKISILLGVPYNWRTADGDTGPDPLLLPLIKSCDIVMPWAVGRYNSSNYASKSTEALRGDVEWCANNKIDYVPLVFPGYSIGNLNDNSSYYNYTPRAKGDFLWKQVAGAHVAGAKSLYVAMFDEIDEGTAIYKCLKEGNLPLNGTKKFVGIEGDLSSDYYLWLTGQARDWFHGDLDLGAGKPNRN